MTVAHDVSIRVHARDGRSLDVYLAGPTDGDVLLFHSGTPSAPIPYAPLTELLTATSGSWSRRWARSSTR